MYSDYLEDPTTFLKYDGRLKPNESETGAGIFGESRYLMGEDIDSFSGIMANGLSSMANLGLTTPNMISSGHYEAPLNYGSISNTQEVLEALYNLADKIESNELFADLDKEIMQVKNLTNITT
jgi:hypothetical protein